MFDTNIARKEGQWFNNANGDTAMESNGFQWRNYDNRNRNNNYQCIFMKYSITNEKYDSQD